MKVEVNVTFNYKHFCIVFAKMFDFSFAPFYEMVIHDSQEDNSLRLCFSNKGRRKTEIIYNAYIVNNPDFVVNTEIYIDLPIAESLLDSIVDSYVGCGWQRTDSCDLNDVKKKMLEDAAMFEAYGQLIGKKT